MYETRDFLEICSEIAIEDLPFSGPLLTWNNGTVWSKLDRVMVNSKWLEDGLHGFVEFMQPGVFSNHAYAVTTLWNMVRELIPISILQYVVQASGVS